MTQSPTPPSPTPDPTPSTPAKKKSSLLKKIVKTLLLLFVLGIIGFVIVVVFFTDTLVREGVKRGGKYATEQETLLDSAKLSLMGGTLNLSNLNIHNISTPSNIYKEPNILSMGSCDVVVDSGSLFTHTVTVPSIDIRGMEFWLEQNGQKNNLADLMEILKKNTSAADAPAAANAPANTTSANTPAQPPGKALKIGHINIVGTKIHIRGIVKADFDLPALQIDDPTNPDGRPMKIADLIGKVLISLAKQIIENPQLPGSMKDAMKNVDKLVGDLKGNMDKELKSGLTKALGDVGKNIDPGKIKLPDMPKIPGLPGSNNPPK